VQADRQYLVDYFSYEMLIFEKGMPDDKKLRGMHIPKLPLE
jgi:hypothetical protein